MKNIFKFSFLAIALFLIVPNMYGHINPDRKNGLTDKEKIKVRSDCAPATMQIDLAINNVRARLLNGGDLWWDLEDGRYIVPKVDPSLGVPGVSSIFAGAVWLGGFDDAGNLKLAAQDYRSETANDFWPGPLSAVGTTGADTCLRWDRFFVVKGESIRDHIKAFQEAEAAGVSLDEEQIPEDLKRYPASGNPYFVEFYGFNLPLDIQGLGSFYDHNGDDLYDPKDGDYPAIDVRGCPLEDNFPDEMVFWLYNDAGNSHTNTQADAIRMEVQVQAFGYSTNDEINDMTFYRYKLINRATTPIDSTFFAMWVDPDLGCFTDDYIGCNVERSLMYVYNEDELDGTTGCDCPTTTGPVPTYCDEVPVLGVDYFRGPRGPIRVVDTFNINFPLPENVANVYDTIFCFNDSLCILEVDTLGELGMSSFTYYMNGSVGNWPQGMTDPQTGAPIEFYRYMSGSWRDGTPFSFGGTGYIVPPGDRVEYAFPNDPQNQAGWSMCTAGLDFGDRRTIQASGPFRLDPGAVNELIVGAVWVADQLYPCPDLAELYSADDLAQALFNNCFILPDGPDAPDLDFIELDRELIMILTNDENSSNNAFELYAETGLEIPEGVEDSLYLFEGYKVFQLSGPEVGPADLDNVEKSRIIFQVDKRNGVASLYNWKSIPNPTPSTSNPDLWIPEEQVMGADAGIFHTFQITDDQFAAENKRLVNHKNYYYMAVAYAYNNYTPFDAFTTVGQRRTYLEGRNNVRQYNPMPHLPVYTKINSIYGEEPIVTRLSGEGAGENFLEVDPETIEVIGTPAFTGEVKYLPGAAPVRIKVVNPLSVSEGSFILEFFDQDGDPNKLSPNGMWRFYQEDSPNDFVLSDRTIASLNEQIIPKFGFSILLGQSDDVGDRADPTNGAIGIEVDYDDPNGPQWLTFVNDGFGGAELFNYVKTGDDEEYFLDDPTQALSTMGNGEFAPFILMDYNYNQDPATNLFGFVTSPMWQNNQARLINGLAKLQDLNNVDIVLTSDKSKWSRCVVVETSNRYDTDLALVTEGKATNMDLRGKLSVGKEAGVDGLPAPEYSAADGELEKGMGWFPGYAYDVETGQRLNIFFGERSVYNADIQAGIPGIPNNGNDMMWNPADLLILPQQAQITNFETYLGGSQYVYVTRLPYDSCKSLFTALRANTIPLRRAQGLANVTWAGIPMLNQGDSLLSYADGLIPNDVQIKLRVDNPYQMEEGLSQFESHPAYRVEFNGVMSREITAEEYPEALAKVNVVPNPYYGYSEYENSQFSNTVKFTNLPAECKITIYSIDGRFIRSYNRNETGIVQSPPRNNPPIEISQIAPDLEWDIRNNKGIPVASGVYLIHIDAPGIGERVLKWFGVNRKFDPSGL